MGEAKPPPPWLSLPSEGRVRQSRNKTYFWEWESAAALGTGQPKIKLALSSLDDKYAKDWLLSYSKYLDKYSDFYIKNRQIIKEKYYNKTGIYLGVNNINNKSYVGNSVNLFNKLNKQYLSNSYIYKNKEKMAICAAIYKYGINKFSFLFIF